MGISENVEQLTEALRSLPERLAAVLAQPLPQLAQGSLTGPTALPLAAPPPQRQDDRREAQPDLSGLAAILGRGPALPALASLPGGSLDGLPTAPALGVGSAAAPQPVGGPAPEGPGQGSAFDRMVQLLERIAAAVEAGGAEGGGREAGAAPLEYGGGGDSSGWHSIDVDADERYPTASPSVNVSSLAGLRGAGGWGFGSAYRERGPLGKGGRQGLSPAARSNFLEPGRREL